MEVIPVLDLLNGKAVHARRGNRKDYQPVESPLCKQGDACELANNYQLHYRLDSLYVADLDALQGRSAQWATLASLSQLTQRIWIDVGCTSHQMASELVTGIRQRGGHTDRFRLIVPTESMQSLDMLRAAIAELQEKEWQIVVSLDLRDGKMLGASELSEVPPIEVAKAIADAGCREMMVIDLGMVGTSSGIQRSAVLHELLDLRNKLQIAWGGGVRSFGDLLELRRMGCSAALVATVLLQQQVTVEELSQL